MKYGTALLVVVIFGAVLAFAEGENPMTAMSYIWKGSVGSFASLGSTIRYMIPCIFLSVSAVVALTSGVNNFGLEGQMYIGSLFAGILGYALKIPPVIHVAVCLAGAAIGGAFWAFIPAVLKLLFSVNEMISSLMLNFVAALLTEYVTMWWILGGSSEGGGAISTPKIETTAEMHKIIKGSSANTGFFIALIVVLAIFFLYRYTWPGYELKQVGQNKKFAQIGGVPILRTFLMIFLLSGLVSGLAGGVEVCGSYNRFTANYIGNTAWDGIMIAYIANMNPIACIVVSFFWAALKAGALVMERNTSLNKLIVNLLQMVFVLFVSIDYRSVIDRITARRKEKAEGV